MKNKSQFSGTGDWYSREWEFPLTPGFKYIIKYDRWPTVGLTKEGCRQNLEGDSLGSSRTCKSAGLRYLARSSLGNSLSIASSPLNSARCSSTFAILHKFKFLHQKQKELPELTCWPGLSGSNGIYLEVGGALAASSSALLGINSHSSSGEISKLLAAS